MWSHLARGSSPVDWCESNYSISPMIAEFVNTNCLGQLGNCSVNMNERDKDIVRVRQQFWFWNGRVIFTHAFWNAIFGPGPNILEFSNILFFLVPPLLMHLFQQYGRSVNPAIHLLWALLIIVGLSSAYFHATLSLLGQLLDELAILWVFVAGFAMFLPRRYFHKSFNGNRKMLALTTTLFGAVSTVGLVMFPWANAFALMLLVIPTVRIMYNELRRVKEGRVYRLGVRTMAVVLLAVFCWILDRAFCEAWLSINFPYMHGIWHVLIFIGGYTTLVMYAYFNVAEENPEQKPQLRYWPRNDFELGIPYITVKYQRKCKDKIAI